MTAQKDNERGSDCGQDQFTTTRWSLVLQAGQEDSPRAAAALEQLCRIYWYPLYAYARRHGHGPEDAEDVVQGFFLQLLQNKSLAHVDRSKGRFRAFLLAALRYYLSDWHDKAEAQKRGGGVPTLRIELNRAEVRYTSARQDGLSPDMVYDYHWALTLLDQVVTRLERQYEETGRGPLFAKLKPLLVESGRGEPYVQLAAELGLTEEAVKKAVQRLRQRYGALFREEIAVTLANPAEVEEELQYLRSIMSA